MMLNLKTGRVLGYTEGQEPLIYLVTTVQEIVAAGVPFVFSDGHGIATFTEWFDDVADLDKGATHRPVVRIRRDWCYH